jgi:hypothetical protein
VKFVVIVCVVFLGTAAALADVPPSHLIDALIIKESSGRDSPPPGDNGTAFGPLQIRQICLDDVNRRHGTSYRAEEMHGNRTLSIWVCERYIDMYATSKRIGRTPTLEDMARIWNGGPSGWRRQSTSRYWQDVQKILRERS